MERKDGGTQGTQGKESFLVTEDTPLHICVKAAQRFPWSKWNYTFCFLFHLPQCQESLDGTKSAGFWPALQTWDFDGICHVPLQDSCQICLPDCLVPLLSYVQGAFSVILVLL